MDADAASDKGVMTFDRQVVNRAAPMIEALHNGAQVAVFIHQTVVAAERADLNESVELVQHPMVWRGI